MIAQKVFLSFLSTCSLFLLPVSSVTFNEKVIADAIQYDANWIDKEAQRVVDLLIVYDNSASVDDGEWYKSKEFLKNFLEYFSISPMDAQLGLVTFDITSEVRIQLKRDKNKCDLIKDIKNLNRTRIGYRTDIEKGLKTAKAVLLQSGRKLIGARPVVVLITDGEWNQGQDPVYLINEFKNMKPKNALVVVITIGAGDKNEMLGWASKDDRGRPMAFAVENFNQFADIAHYIHGGSHQSLTVPLVIDKRKCSVTCSEQSICACDSLSNNGIPACACKNGHFVKRKNGKDVCEVCPIGTYQDEILTTDRKCSSCPKGQTTLSVGSSARSQCVCEAGYWNPKDHSRNPGKSATPCTPIKCQRDSAHELDLHSLSLNGSCQYKYGETCRYECHSGHITSGVTRLECGKGGVMNFPLPKCHALQCPIVSKVPHSAGWKCERDSKAQNGDFPYKTECRNQCKPGYLPKPGTSQFIICGLDLVRTNGKWSGNALVCEPQTCTILPEVSDGQYNLQECSHVDADRFFGKVCSVKCDHGYIISEDISWTCQANGQWSNHDKTVFCKDVRPPEFLTCPQHLTMDNEESEGYALVKLQPLEAFDNDASGTITQTLTLKLLNDKVGTEYPCSTTSKLCGEEYFKFPIGTSSVNFTASDRAKNSASCIFTVTVKDIEAPEVVQCDGPVKDEKGFIYADDDEKEVTWKLPEFSDNSGKQDLEIFSTGSPGVYRVGRTWTITYTAKDTAGNTAKCEFSFKLSGVRCPELLRPANGAMVCDKLAFGVYCVPQCEKGLKRLLPDDISRIPADYFCSVKGKWLPHDTVGDCSLMTPVNEDTLSQYEFTWYEGNCNDEQTKQQIIQNTIDALESGGPSFVGQGFKATLDKTLTKDDFEVFCGPKNESIIQIGGGARSRRSAGVQPQLINMYGVSLGSN